MKLEIALAYSNHLRDGTDGLVGKTFALADAIKGGEGTIRVNDTRWKVRGPDMPAGTKVRVTGIEDATILKVEQV